ncbi:MAG TPA: 30S ribosomal protein S5 [Persephonella sp.]|uniref:Small ribosomal subunit protein uS5 n=1 Tax=Persephonella marina (strain DSM 14350 / EX-H1) TaxID=123214 RepID=RS5_PERMH|nr:MULTISPECIES: 30S ribosomal protein S5 [Persephonella]C0QQP0.1 RecName: Full=Small ribosomal subunit protein uS5; AltName: Full=30S ribosomal protein S5 [Persephonella marina EX-H1]ACO02972.1 ribosomal protein S5 [Persephonella marina EX-H1]HCB68737.1 30S ribosomal protein S5 [Persephonella sp.]
MGVKNIERLIEERQKIEPINPAELTLEEKVVEIRRTTRVVEGGRRFSFSTLAVVGDRNGHVGFGHGKANEVPPSIAKAIADAKKHLIRVPLIEGTIPHDVIGKYESAVVLLKPARKGTGVVAGGPVRPVLELLGVTDILTKIIGRTTNPNNTVRAVFDALLQIRSPEQVAAIRGVDEEKIRKNYRIYASAPIVK